MEKALMISIFILMACSLVSAVGVSMYYYEGKPLIIGPGETKTIEVASLIASHETQDKDVKIEILEGSDIASVAGSDISVVAGSVDNVIKLKISIPDVAEGMEYVVKIKTSELTPPEGGGMVGFTTSKVTSMPILVQKSEETPTGISYTWIILGIVVVILVVIIVKFVLKSKEAPAK